MRAASKTARASVGRNHHKPLEVKALRNFDYPEAILFDCDGVLCETERDGHRVTFNMTFQEKMNASESISQRRRLNEKVFQGSS